MTTNPTAAATPAATELSDARHTMRRPRRSRRTRTFRLAVLTAAIAAFGICIASAAAAISVTRAELNGFQLRVEGRGALQRYDQL